MTLEEYKSWSHIDYNDEDDLLNEIIEVAQIYLDSKCGEEYKKEPKAVKLANLALRKIVNDLYENRTGQVASNYKEDPVVKSIVAKLTLYNWEDNL